MEDAMVGVGRHRLPWLSCDENKQKRNVNPENSVMQWLVSIARRNEIVSIPSLIKYFLLFSVDFFYHLGVDHFGAPHLTLVSKLANVLSLVPIFLNMVKKNCREMAMKHVATTFPNIYQGFKKKLTSIFV